MNFDLVKDLWWLLSPLVISLIWLIRLEARVKDNSKDLDTIEKEIHEIKKVHDVLTDIKRDIQWIKEIFLKNLKVKIDINDDK